MIEGRDKRVPVPPTKLEDTYKGFIACSIDDFICYDFVKGDF
jgi:hypothetical protein